jgi:hypothetical protein
MEEEQQDNICDIGVEEELQEEQEDEEVEEVVEVAVAEVRAHSGKPQTTVVCVGPLRTDSCT